MKLNQWIKDITWKKLEKPKIVSPRAHSKGDRMEHCTLCDKWHSLQKWPHEQQSPGLKAQLEAMKTYDYNQSKRINCQYCGALEGMYCRDGCEAMMERMRNNVIDEIILHIKK